jgi:predicted phosphate transport protein (TIGR00153 family)
MVKHFERMSERAKEIRQVEHQGDQVTHEIIARLNKTFVLPIDQEDIHTLTSGLDDVLDYIDAVADRIFLYKISKPTDEAISLAEILFRATQECSAAVAKLRDVKANADSIMHHCVEINSLENACDRLYRATVAQLFEKMSDPIEIIKWKEIYENFETASDRCEDVANVIEGVVLKYT